MSNGGVTWEALLAEGEAKEFRLAPGDYGPVRSVGAGLPVSAGEGCVAEGVEGRGDAESDKAVECDHGSLGGSDKPAPRVAGDGRLPVEPDGIATARRRLSRDYEDRVLEDAVDEDVAVDGDNLATVVAALDGFHGANVAQGAGAATSPGDAESSLTPGGRAETPDEAPLSDDD